MKTPGELIGEIRTHSKNAVMDNGQEPLLVAVTKGQSVETIRAYYSAGLKDFGENRVQEAVPKIKALPKDIRWHFIGHLQSNKVKEAVGQFALIHSVDSPKLLERINAMARELGITQNILLEVNVSGEKTKYGFKVEETTEAMREAKELKHIMVLGLMTVAPYGAKEEELHRIFGKIRGLRDNLGLRELSMGMSDDFEIAVSEGATIIRIGRALFGPSPKT
jgi:pyridoxal phosphate enzyme (YggS family)